MYTPLDLPLEESSTTRRADRRVVAIIVAILGGIALGFLASRAPYVLSSTLGVRPNDTLISIRVLRSPGNLTILNEKWGTFMPLHGLPMNLPALCGLGAQECTVHIGPHGAMSLAIDGMIDEATIAQYGWQIWRDDETTLITPPGTSVDTHGKRIILGAFLPWYDGDVTLVSEDEDRAMLTLSSRAITLHGFGIPGALTANPTIPAETKVIAASSIAEQLIGTIGNSETLESIAPISAFFSALSTHGASALLTQDADGLGYYLSTDARDISVDDASAIGKDLMNRMFLSTVQWTSDDGEVFEELRADTEDLVLDIQAEEYYTFLTLTMENNVLRITKTPEILTISNRDVAIADAITPHSTCLRNAHTWVSADAWLKIIGADVKDGLLATFIEGTTEIALNARKIRLCW